MEPEEVKKRPSIKDVAREAGVSTATVSHVFSGKKPVHEASAQKVRRAAEKLGYTMDRVAAQLRTRRTKIIAVLVPNLEDLFLNRFISLIESRAEDAGYQVIVSCSRDDLKTEQDRLRALMGWRPSGLILVPCIDAIPDMLAKQHPEGPVVAVDRVNPAFSKYDTVTTDDYASGRDVGQHLVDLDARSILVVATSDKIFTQKERIRGVEDCAREAGNVIVNTLIAGPDAERAAGKLSEWLDAHPETEAVIGLTNVMTLAALSTFAARGIEPPKGIMLTGFHDSLWMTARRVPITTVAQPVDAIADAAWERIFSRIGKDDAQVRHVIFKSTLIKRRSTLDH